ncbi:MAG TPA: DinB family protein [Gemmatimonadota bacterium]|nr:DinB family protein [Gemmatimonadota bacterium]
MSVQDVLAGQFRTLYGAAARNLEGMSRQASLVQPQPAGNCAAWILSHLVHVQNAVMEVVGSEPVWEGGGLAGPRSAPIVSGEGAPDWDELRDRFLGSRDRCVEAIAALTDAALEDPLPGPFGDTTTRAGLLGFLAFHQAYHVGQLGMARRLAGLDGAIAGPAPREPAGA